jgi:hypothetical protein
MSSSENDGITVPPEIAEILGKPPVLGLENRRAYDALLLDLARVWAPRDTGNGFTSEIWPI